MKNNNESYDKFISLLKDMFQFDSSDLDFGIYKIMNLKKEKISEFIDNEISKKIKNQLNIVSDQKKSDLQKKIDDLEKNEIIKNYLHAISIKDQEKIKMYEQDFEPNIKEYNDAKNQLSTICQNEDFEKQIYNHLLNFFSRYYENGDFITKRRYGRNEKYIIPYNGEETLLYWVNKDQYYVKTTENFYKFTFIADLSIYGKFTVNFRISDAEVEKGNEKSNEKKFFVLDDNTPISIDEANKTIDIYFSYRSLSKNELDKLNISSNPTQDKINESTINSLEQSFNNISKKNFYKLLNDKKSDTDKSILEKNLNKYTRKNTSDYFIHKDLKTFLYKELDFYIKNEYLSLEDIEILNKPLYQNRLKTYLSSATIFDNIAKTIIDFLAQIEDFQKKLWEKKKFVINTNYVITIDKLMNNIDVLNKIMYHQNINNQIQEWKELNLVDDDFTIENIWDNTINGKEIKTEYIHLPIDTKYFKDIEYDILSIFDDIDEELNGILIKSENYQALNLLKNKYEEKVKCIYIDPPYNTGNDGFLYKDKYMHSTWLSMMNDRLSLARDLMKNDGAIFISIDDNEVHNLRRLMDLIYGDENFVATLKWKKKKQPSFLHNQVSSITEYIITFGRNIKNLDKLSLEKIAGDTKPLFNANNNESIKVFPKGIRANFEKGIINKGKIQIRTMTIEYLDDVVIKNGRTLNMFKLKGRFRDTQENINNYAAEDLIFITTNYALRRNVAEEEKLKKKMITDLLLDWGQNQDAFNELYKIFGGKIPFDNPKPTLLIKNLNKSSTQNKSIVLDFFAGSGTTAHAVMQLNKEDGGNRKFILVEMADYFDTIILPRIKKLAYSLDWKDGKPIIDKNNKKSQELEIDLDEQENINTNNGGIFVKYQTIEQYEDSLENIVNELKPDELLLYTEIDDYLIKYMIDWENKDSNIFLNPADLQDPFNYKLYITKDYIQQLVGIDLIETFNYLFGLHLKKYYKKVYDDIQYVAVLGEKEGKTYVIIWRPTKNINVEKDKENINDILKNINIDVDEIYVNTDAILDRSFNVIDSLFKNLMLNN